MATVSYTHLDVYKRQAGTLPGVAQQTAAPAVDSVKASAVEKVFIVKMADVYKRQHERSAGIRRRPYGNGALQGFYEAPGIWQMRNHGAVSYTHLDVYKRQGGRYLH